MPGSDADRNLLFGILALQMDFISRDALIAGMNAWVLDKHQALGSILVDRGVLEPSDRVLTEQMVERHLRKHGDAAERSLGALGAFGAAREVLGELSDPDIQASLGHLASDPNSTHSWRSGPDAEGPRFRVLRPHARGGLGLVSIALDAELHREVALKEIHRQHADSMTSRARFLLEAEITGRLEHPGVVPVYGLGTGRDGRPYYAMRFVKGDTLKEALDAFHQGDADPGRDPGERSLALRKLLTRFVAVCEAVSYAHSRGVIHRDLKPANILLGPYGETLVVDWGLAKVVGRSDGGVTTEATLHPRSGSGSGSTETQTGAAIGTPAYMSPEQAEGKLDAVGPASDVYGLGATLYSVLTGQPPFSGDVADVLHKVRRGEFPAPRQANPRVPRPLEGIVLKAVARDPGDRYESPRALAEDIEHWLADEPIAAYREPWRDRARRWMRQHRTQTTAAAVAVLIGIIGLGSTLGVLTAKNRELAESNQELTRERNRAQRREDQAITGIKRFADVVREEPELKNNPALEALRKRLLKEPEAFFRSLSAGLRAENATRPEALSRLASAIAELARITDQIGSKTNALESHREALMIRERLAREHPAVAEYRRDLAASHTDIGDIQYVTGEVAGAGESFRAALAIQERLAREHPAVADYQIDEAQGRHNVGVIHDNLGRSSEALEYYQQALAIRERLVREHPTVAAYQKDLATSLDEIGFFHSDEGRSARSLELHRRALAIWKRLTRANPAVAAYQKALATSLYGVGVFHASMRQWSEALGLYREALAIRERLARANPTITDYQNDLAESHHVIGGIHHNAGESSKALESYQQALAIRERLAREHPAVADYQHRLANLHNDMGGFHLKMGRPSKALESYQQALAIRERLAREHPADSAYQRNMAAGLQYVGMIRDRLGQSSKALESYQQALAIQERLAREHPADSAYQRNMAAGLQLIGSLHNMMGESSKALESYQQALAIRERLARGHPADAAYQNDLVKGHQYVGLIHDRLGQSSKALGSYREALTIRERLARADPTITDYQNDLAESHHVIGGIHHNAGESSKALESYQQALAIRERLAREHPAVADYQHRLANLHSDMGSLRHKTGELSKALGSYRVALTIRERLALAHPASNAYQGNMAVSLQLIGSLHNMMGESSKALESYQQALAIRERLARGHPADAAYQNDLALGLQYVGVIHDRLGQSSKALGSYREALTIRERLARADPTKLDYQRNLATINKMLGVCLLAMPDRAADARESFEKAIAIQERMAGDDPACGNESLADPAKTCTEIGIRAFSLGRFSEAAAFCERAIAHWERLESLAPATFEYPHNHAKALHYLAHCHWNQGRPEPARKALRAAIACQRRARAVNPRDADSRNLMRASLDSLNRLAREQGDPEEAAAVAREWAEVFADSPADLYDVARRFALNASATKEESARRQYADEAARGLRAAIAAGWSNADFTAHDASLVTLRDRPDFRRLLAELFDRGFPAQAFAK